MEKEDLFDQKWNHIVSKFIGGQDIGEDEWITLEARIGNRKKKEYDLFVLKYEEDLCNDLDPHESTSKEIKVTKDEIKNYFYNGYIETNTHNLDEEYRNIGKRISEYENKYNNIDIEEIENMYLFENEWRALEARHDSLYLEIREIKYRNQLIKYLLKHLKK